MHSFARLSSLSVMSVMLCTALIGCAASDDDVPALTAASSAATRATQLRLVHASATSAAFDVYLGAESAPAFTGLSFGTSTAYLGVVAGGTDLVFRAAGAPATATPLFTGQVVVNDGETVTAVAAGLLGSTLETTRFRVQGLVEEFGAARRREQRLRFVQASHGLPSTGFDVNADDAVEVDDVPAFTASASAGVLVQRDPDGLQLAITSGVPATRRTAFTVPAEFTTGGDGAFVVLAGLPSFQPRETRGLSLIVVGHDQTVVVEQNPTVYVLPVIPDLAGVDIAAGPNRGAAAPIATGAGFAALASIQVPPTTRGLAIVIRDPACGEIILSTRTGELAAGERYLAVASGFASGRRNSATRPAVQLDVFTEAFTAPLTGPGYLRAVAASPGAPLLDVGRFPPGQGTAFVQLASLEALAYRAASAPLGTQVAAAPLNPGVRASGTTTIARFGFAALPASDRVFGVVAGAWTPEAGDVGLRFVVVKTPASGAWTAQALSPQ